MSESCTFAAQNPPAGVPSPAISRRRAWLGFAAAPLFVAPFWYLCVWPYLPGVPGQFAGAILVPTLVVCAITDLTARRIMNWATYPAFSWALVAGVAVDLVGAGYLVTRPVFEPVFLGERGFVATLGGAAACFVVLLVIHMIARGGAGDVKLATVLGALLGAQTGLMAVACTYIVAAAVMLAWNVLRRPGNTVFGFLRSIGSWVLPLWISAPSMDEQELLGQRMPMAPFFAAGTLVALVLEWYR